MLTGFLNINNKNIYYHFINPEFSNNTDDVLIFLHEGLGSIGQWKDFPEKLSKKLEMPALIYDRYGYGKSDGLSENRNPNYLEEDAKNYMPFIFNKLLKPNSNKIIIGHSDGGSLALLYAAMFPENTKAIIIEAAHLFIEDLTYNSVKKMYDIFYKRGLKKSLEKYHGKNTVTMFHGWYDVWTNPEYKNWNIENYLKLIKCPVLAIQGDKDEYGSIKQLDSLKNNIKSFCQIELIKNCGHAPHFEAEEEITELTLSFIQDL
ncbi:MAG: alpha/beta hydrolase [Bacteroidales bacterium]|jgi:pimeloyl-ACP methyl ester carboxylesterase|nr:alpha/beta hydrolase [Bacteroidales bacterium]MCK9497995.1 alpha/beta hydrolase [Bacteroidales bacterium]MDY0314723.1 alpha/beta hydrolase [Bacteroidales bacterium]NLB86555.1 alpha/beta hydrolase [Bacteroidales bacterium]